MARRATQIAVVEPDTENTREVDDTEVETSESMSPTPPVTVGRKPRLTPDQRQEIIAELTAGNPMLDISKKYNISYTTVANIKRSTSSIDVPTRRRSTESEQPSGESELRRRVYLVGFATVTGENVDPNEITELKTMIEEKQKQSRIQFALSL